MGGGFGPHAPPRPAPPGRAGQDGGRVELVKAGKRDGLARQEVTPTVTAVKSTRGNVVPENARIPALARWAFRLHSVRSRRQAAGGGWHGRAAAARPGLHHPQPSLWIRMEEAASHMGPGTWRLFQALPPRDLF